MKRRNTEVNIFSMSALDLFASALGAFILLTVVFLPFFPNTGDSPRISEAMRERMANLDAQVSAYEADSTDLQVENATLRGENAALQSQNGTLQSQNTALQSETTELRSQNATLQSANESLQNQNDQLTGQVSEMEAQMQELQAALEACEAQNSQASGVAESLRQCEISLNKTFLLVTISWETEDDIDLHIVDPQGNEFYYAAKRHSGSEATFEEDTINGPGNEVWLHPNTGPGEYKVYFKYYRQDTQSVSVRGSVVYQGGRQDLPGRTLSVAGEKPLIATIVVDDDGEVTLR